MHRILLNYPLPQSFKTMWGPGSSIALNMKYWIAGLVVSGVIAWWGLAPDVPKGRRLLGWLGTLAAFGFALVLAGIGLGRLPEVQLHTYGVLVAIGFLIGIILAVREARRVGEDAERILDLAFWLLIAAMLGARLLYIGLHWSEYAADMSRTKIWYQWKVFRLWEGGLIFYGGLFLALLVCLAFTRLYKMNFWKLTDVLVPSVALGQFFGLLGSYAAGFSFGKPTTMPWFVQYSSAPRGVDIPLNTALHPTPLYSALGVLLLFFILMWVRSAKKYHGQVFVSYMLLYPVLSFVVELFRNDFDTTRVFFFNIKKSLLPAVSGAEVLTWNQVFSITFFVFALIILFQRMGQAATQEAS